MKRLLDLLFAGMALISLAPILVIIAFAIKIGSPGPVFHLAVRAGRNGIPFRMFKFRSMVVGAERLGGLSTGRDDPRITPVGRFLRRHKLDELPQLLNVLAGDMSVVGPRPEFPEYTRLYAGDEALILTVRPGLTDFSSLKFFRLDESLGSEDPDRAYEERVRPIKNALRVQYVKKQSFSTDCCLVLRTVLAIAKMAVRGG